MIFQIKFIAALFLAALAAHGAEIPPLKATATATAGKSRGATIKDGKQVSFVNACVTVGLHGGVAKEAYAYGNIDVQPIVVDGKKCLPEKDQSKGKFKFIEATEPSDQHPEGGFHAMISYGEIDEAAKTIDAVKGSIEVLVGGVEHEVIIDDLAGRKEGLLNLADLKNLNLKIEFERSGRFEGDAAQAAMTAVSIMMNAEDKMSIAGIQLIQEDGKIITDTFTGGWVLGSYVGQCWIKDQDLETTKIKLLVRKGWERKALPFEVKGVEIK